VTFLKSLSGLFSFPGHRVTSLGLGGFYNVRKE
jgi:hypothetical protein